MRPAQKSKIIVRVNLSQKESYVANGITFYTGSQFNFDGRISGPVLATVLSVGYDIKDVAVGDKILCTHNTFTAHINERDLYGDTGEVIDGENVFCIDYSSLELKLGENGEAIPIKKCLLVERLYLPPVSTIIIDPNPKTYLTKFRVLSVGEDCDGIEKGTIIECYKHSDYEMNYFWNGEKRQVFKVRYDDVHSLDTSGNDYGYKPEKLEIV